VVEKKNRNNNPSLGRFLISALLCILSLGADAARAKIEWHTYVQPDGTVLTLTLSGDEHFSCYRDFEGRMYSRDSLGVFRLLPPDQVPSAPMVMSRTRAGQPDKSYSFYEWNADSIYRRLVILVSFSDCDFSFEDPLATYDAMFNQSGYNQRNGPGCVADYFRDQSRGLFNLKFDVYGPIKVSKSVQNVNISKNYGQDVFSEAARKLVETHPDIDYSVYDWDNDGVAEPVVFVYAGYSGNQAAIIGSGYIWPNSASFSIVKTPDGYSLYDYTASGELWTNNTSCGIGLICHEFSHGLGLPDIYPTSSSNTAISLVDEWDLMDGGTFTNYGWCPPNFSPIEKMLMGWLVPVELTADTTITDLAPVAHGGEVYLIRHTADEFYLLENRQWEGWDYGLPGRGLVIYHVLFDRDHWRGNYVNYEQDKPYYSIVAADNMTYMDWYNYCVSQKKSQYIAKDRLHSRLMSTAPYPCLLDTVGTMNRTLTDTSVPAARMYTADADGNTMLSKSITKITQNDDGTVSFRFRASPASSIHSLQSDSSSSGIYTLSGRRLPPHTDIHHLQKGIYIVKGRKIALF